MVCVAEGHPFDNPNDTASRFTMERRANPIKDDGNEAIYGEETSIMM